VPGLMKIGKDIIVADIYSQAGQILDALREIELIMAELYRQFSHSFREDRVFWESLSQDEENHAAMVIELKNTLFKNGSPFEIGKINVFVLRTYRQGLTSQIERLQKGQLARRSAFFFARDFEKTLVEHRFYDSIRSENGEYQAIQRRIQRETEIHLQKLENYIKTLFS
jgi:1,2-phenylacetyl-CoA epoxidase catalytic subunit